MESKEEHIMDAEMEDAEEVFAFSYDDGDDGDDGRFSQIVGALEDIIMMSSFSELQNTFCEKHCHHFEDTEENKLVYTELHERYVGVMEEFLDRELRRRVDAFSMEDFEMILVDRVHEVFGDVFDILQSLTDFCEFKDLMLSHRALQLAQGDDKAGGAGGGGGGVGAGGGQENVNLNGMGMAIVPASYMNVAGMAPVVHSITE